MTVKENCSKVPLMTPTLVSIFICTAPQLYKICRLILFIDELNLSCNFAQAAGKYKQEGKTYVVQDGDIIFFKFNVSGGGKK